MSTNNKSGLATMTPQSHHSISDTIFGAANTFQPQSDKNSIQYRQTLCCFGCHQPCTKGNHSFIQALDRIYHLECFVCEICSVPVTAKYYTIVKPSTAGDDDDDDDDKSNKDANVDKHPYNAKRIVCERHYYLYHDRACKQCNEPLDNDTIETADGFKFHAHCIQCPGCLVSRKVNSNVVAQKEAPFQYGDRFYCRYHYSLLRSTECLGCGQAILQAPVQDLNLPGKIWHNECYKIDKFWNIRLADPDQQQRKETFKLLNPAELCEVQTAMERKRVLIWRSMHAFEESSAMAISDLSLHIASGAYHNGVCMATQVTCHLNVLFTALDRVDELLRQHGQALECHPWSRDTCKILTDFFFMLIRPAKAQSVLIDQMRSIVANLAKNLKLLMRMGLAEALRLEYQYGTKHALDCYLADFVAHEKTMLPSGQYQFNDTALASCQTPSTSVSSTDMFARDDYCHLCKDVIDDTCYRYSTDFWHLQCLKCDVCKVPVGTNRARRVCLPEQTMVALLCDGCCTRMMIKQGCTVEWVSLTHMTHLQHDLSRLQSAMAYLQLYRSPASSKKSSETIDFSKHDMMLHHGTHSHHRKSSSLVGRPEAVVDSTTTATQVPALFPPVLPSFPSVPVDSKTTSTTTTTTHTSKTKRTKSAQFDRSKTPSTTLHTQVGHGDATVRRAFTINTNSTNSIHSAFSSKWGTPDASAPQKPTQLSATVEKINTLRRTISAGRRRERGPVIQSLFGGGSNQERDDKMSMASVSAAGQQETTDQGLFLSSPSSLHLHWLVELPPHLDKIMRYVTVYHIAEAVGDMFTLEELLGMMECKKTTLWGKLKTHIRGGGHKHLTDSTTSSKTFGVPLISMATREQQPQYQGLANDAVRAAALDRLQQQHPAMAVYFTSKASVPILVQNCILALLSLDVSVEGIFRKNGNIRELNQLCESIDSFRTPQQQYGLLDTLLTKSPIQVAALLKRFLRELPEPLLTYKLYRLFLTALRADTPERTHLILHFACCMLPKPNRDLMQILFLFLNWVASFHESNKMHISNLASVIAPSVLCAPTSKEGNEASRPASTGVPSDEIQVIALLIQHQHKFCVIPNAFLTILRNNRLCQDWVDPSDPSLPPKELIRTIAQLIKLSKQNTSTATVTSRNTLSEEAALNPRPTAPPVLAHGSSQPPSPLPSTRPLATSTATTIGDDKHHLKSHRSSWLSGPVHPA